MDSAFQFLTVLLLFVFVLVITFLTTKWIAKVQRGQMTKGNNLEVLETLKITSDKYIQIVRAGNKYLVIAIGKNEINMLSEIDLEDLEFKDADVKKTASFASVLEMFKKKEQDAEKEETEDLATVEESSGDDE